MSGLERSPVYPGNREPTNSKRQLESLGAFNVLMDHDASITRSLGLKSDRPFRATQDTLRARADQLKRLKDAYYMRTRTTHDIGKLLFGTVSEVEDEFRGQTVLDIGTGEGKFGQQIARNAKAKVVFLDIDIEQLSKIPKRLGGRVQAQGLSLPFPNEVFQKTVSSFSALMWAEDPAQSVQALNEALRVTAVGGTHFAVPIVSSLESRKIHESSAFVARLGLDLPEGVEDPAALDVWSLQDHAVLHSLQLFAEAGYCSISWCGIRGKDNDGTPNELYSAIIDKQKPIPDQVFAETMAYANSLYEHAE